ncbi:MAG: hypothetical protein QF476_04805 [Dehalococcoidia bacterium]|jgi:hypothetical protein|nr:hypothetical protein [Chloroflexota bacterium]MDP6056101.1 hypothetical protein [Dehalococcoidia bacterium]MDP7485361.1 hypothetical protein [Dehalococcoidia bacterium]|tara:strand:- start:5208 stop:5510 length:303 start_codon:yes stop_codon:yes gene_type:complete
MWMEDVGMNEEKLREGNLSLTYISMIVLLVITNIFIVFVVNSIDGGFEEDFVVDAVLWFVSRLPTPFPLFIRSTNKVFGAHERLQHGCGDHLEWCNYRGA